jgi:hypothetical protein
LRRRKIVWEPGMRFRAFVDVELGSANIVGNELVDDATSCRIGDVLIVCDRASRVCDVEVKLRTLNRGSPVDRAQTEAARQVSEPVTTAIGEPEAVVAWGADSLMIRFGNRSGGEWLRLGDTPVYISIAGESLEALAVLGAEHDPGGRREAAWLDEIEMRSGSRSAGP